MNHSRQTTPPEPSRADHLELALSMAFQNTSAALPQIVDIMLADDKTIDRDKFITGLWTCLGANMSGFVERLLGRRFPLVVADEIQEVAQRQGFQFANPFIDDLDQSPEWTPEEMQAMQQRGDDLKKARRRSFEASKK